MSAGVVCFAALLLHGALSLEQHSKKGLEYMEVATTHFESGGRMMRRHTDAEHEASGRGRVGVEVGAEARASSAKLSAPCQDPSQVKCGGHCADTCTACSQGKGRSWCNDDCKWTGPAASEQTADDKANDAFCVAAAPTATKMSDSASETLTVATQGRKKCGGHYADSCAECPSGAPTGKENTWCNNDCLWSGTSTSGNAADQCIDRPAQAVETIVQWGGYKFTVSPETEQCKEQDGSGADVAGWEGQSAFAVWKGTDSGLTMNEGSVVNGGVLAGEANGGLRLYKAACPNATTVRIGGVTPIPSGASTIEIVFGITRRCTGDCAPLMLSVLDAADDSVKYRWCFNREGNSSDIHCDSNEHLDLEKWHRKKLDMTPYTDFVAPIKLAVEVYTSGDFRLLPALEGEAGLGGRSMVLIDSLVLGPDKDDSLRPNPDRTADASGSVCRQSMQDPQVCPVNSWCFDKYRCDSVWCVPANTRCNGKRNCAIPGGRADDSDEVGCEYKKGFRVEFFLNHARELTKSTNIDDLDSLTQPDIRTFDGDLGEKLEYDSEDFWKKIHAKDNFAARWMGNISITTAGKYSFAFPSSGDTKLNIQGIGSVSEKEWNLTHSSNGIAEQTWVHMPSGKYQLTLSFVHLHGEPNIKLEYAGMDTSGSTTSLTRDSITATLTGAHCDTMHCPSDLSPKDDSETILCKGVPCNHAEDTSTCCTRKYKVVACGDYRTCALDMGGRPFCWGSWDGFQEEWKKHPGPFVDISSRGKYTCAVHTDHDAKDSNGKSLANALECWQPDSGDTPLIDFSEGVTFKNISVGGEHTCGIQTSDTVVCRPPPLKLQELLGTGQDSQRTNVRNPQADYLRVSAGSDFTCGIKQKVGFLNGVVQCWGANDHGQTEAPCDRTISDTCGTACGENCFDRFTHVSAGDKHACGVANGRVYCWGENNAAQATPPTGNDFYQVAAGGRHTCALKACDPSGCQVKCWGADEAGQSTPIEDEAPYLSISAGADHTCAIRATDNEIVCWGSNHEAQKDGTMAWRGQSEPPPAGAHVWPDPTEVESLL